jgi:hypothetical protein
MRIEIPPIPDAERTPLVVSLSARAISRSFTKAALAEAPFSGCSALAGNCWHYGTFIPAPPALETSEKVSWEGGHGLGYVDSNFLGSWDDSFSPKRFLQRPLVKGNLTCPDSALVTGETCLTDGVRAVYEFFGRCSTHSWAQRFIIETY